MIPTYVTHTALVLTDRLNPRDTIFAWMMNALELIEKGEAPWQIRLYNIQFLNPYSGLSEDHPKDNDIFGPQILPDVSFWRHRIPLLTEYLDAFVNLKQKASRLATLVSVPTKLPALPAWLLPLRRNCPGRKTVTQETRQTFLDQDEIDVVELPLLFCILTDLKQDNKDFHVINDNLFLKHAHNLEAVPCEKVGNVFLVIFTTSYERLHLNAIMEPLNTRVMYHDTDSIVYVHDHIFFILPGPSGWLLREPNERMQGNRIREFVNAGPNSMLMDPRNQSCQKDNIARRRQPYVNTVYRENFAPVLFSPFCLRANSKLGELNYTQGLI